MAKAFGVEPIPLEPVWEEFLPKDLRPKTAAAIVAPAKATPTDAMAATWQDVPLKDLGLPLQIILTLEEDLSITTLGGLIQAQADKAERWTEGHLGEIERKKVEAAIDAYEQAHPAVSAAINAHFCGPEPAPKHVASKSKRAKAPQPAADF